jgi:hypothetical protein
MTTPHTSGAADLPEALQKIMSLADEYANAEACAVTATSKAHEDTSAERSALENVRDAIARREPTEKGNVL